MTSFPFLRHSHSAQIIILIVILIVIPSSAQLAPAGRTFAGTFYPAQSLGYALETNYFARTNAIGNYNPATDQPWTGYVWGNTNIARYRLNTNSVLYGKQGATSISVAQFGGTVNRLCLVTPRHAVGLAHYGTPSAGSLVWFMGTNGAVHGMTTSHAFASDLGEQLEVVTFTQDVPADVQPARVIGPLTNAWQFIQSFFPPAPAISRQLAICQHGYVGVCGQPHPGGAVCGQGGDSGSTGFIMLGDELLYTGVFSSKPSPFMQQKINELTLRLGLQTNDYQMRIFNLTNYPKWNEAGLELGNQEIRNAR